MSKSLVQMVHELFTRVAALEAQLKAAKPDPVLAPLKVFEAEQEKPNRAMCPHCGVKPNHFFHVKYCPEKNKNNGTTTQPRRDPSTP